MKKQKKQVMKPASMDEVEQLFAQYAKADAQMVELNAQMDLEFTAIRKRNADKLTALAEKKEECFNSIQVFAEANEKLFDKKKSMELAHGKIGFRTGTPKLKPRKGFTWASTLELLKEFLPSYVRTVEEPAKDKLLADRDTEDVQEYIKKVGLDVVQDETFYIDLKKEEVTA